MNLILKSLIFCCIVYLNEELCEANVTKVSRKNVLLSRRKRYLLFPMGSNFVISMAGAKTVQQVQPRGWIILGEVDVPFALPYDTRLFRTKKRHSVERREVFAQLELGLTQIGFNGMVCIKRMMCDAQKYIPLKGKSLMVDLVLALFIYSGEDFKTNQESCDPNMWSDCSVSFLDYLFNNFEKVEYVN